jgi:hypothetical protein
MRKYLNVISLNMCHIFLVNIIFIGIVFCDSKMILKFYNYYQFILIVFQYLIKGITVILFT